jgi:V8-like Glu-specific endopeptidase
MGYSRTSGTEYVGTGWLIADDIIVTAGHCLYDSKGGYLQYIKAYVGYVGPESDAKQDKNCQMRLGKHATAPVEYIKTSNLVHDVGFVSRNPTHRSAVSDI